MAVNNVTPNFGFELPNPLNELQDDVLRLVNALQAIDTALHAETGSLTSQIAAVSAALTSYASLSGNASQTFSVATATAPTEAVPLAQAESLFAPASGSAAYAPAAGNALQVFDVAPATTATEAVPLAQLQVVQVELQGSVLNLCPDPGFTVGAGVWPDAQILAANAAGVPANAPSANVVMSVGTGNGDPNLSPVGPNVWVPCQPGDLIDYELWVGLPSALTTSVGLGVNSSATYPVISGVVGVGLGTVPGGATGWNKVSGTYVVPAGVYAVQVFFWMPGAVAGATAYFAAPRITKRSAASQASIAALQSQIQTLTNIIYSAL